jgi:DNA-binding transcriptional ArsR family regulator
MSDETRRDRGEEQGLDYELDDEIAADTPTRLKALADQLRLTVLDLVLERAMTVTELAERLHRPKGTVAYHVDLLVDAGLLQVVRTRRVRAVNERFYGRAARTINFHHSRGDLAFVSDALAEADFDRLAAKDPGAYATLRHARIPAAEADEFAARLNALALEFIALPRGGDVEYGLLIAVYPTTRLPAEPSAADPRADPAAIDPAAIDPTGGAPS